MKKNKFSNIENIIHTAKKGKMYILVDDENRENEGDLVFCAADVSANKINFMAKHGRGLICLAINSTQAKKLDLNYMSPVNESRNQTAFTVSIESKKGVTTGISAKDRAKTIKVATKNNVNKKDIVSPGHVFPIISREGGVLVRAGHTEASVDISKLAKKKNSAVICEIMNEDGTMAKGDQLHSFAKKHNLKIGKIDDLIAYRLKKEKLIKLKKTSTIIVKNNKFRIKIFDNELWIYIERKTSSMPIYRLGKTKTVVNNVLVLEINNMGLLAKKDFLNIDNMNEINFTDKITLNNYKKKSFVYDFLSSMRQRINDPLGKRRKIE